MTTTTAQGESFTGKLATILLDGNRPAELWIVGGDTVLLWGELATNPHEAIVDVEGPLATGCEIVVVDRVGRDRIAARVA